MLVLSRKEGERIVIGDNITLIVSKVSGNRVTIGIEAPREVKVVRGELEDSGRMLRLESWLREVFLREAMNPEALSHR
jgi:carbon storage regulator